MSSEPFVRLRGLGKKFALYRSAGQRVGDLLFGWGSAGEHWAVRDVSLELRPGACLGIVGRNGAGKSTLLELVCGILQPSEGTVETAGRIAAMLQLGAGFNPEFTGRENVLLGASLYGLSEARIRERFASIEAFAEIGSYIDRPVREYSSGMYARLAFSVCAHVDADILVIDEILGIGDVAFQQKSMRFLRRFRRSGITLFVSHDEHAVSALCDGAIWIDDGRIVAQGDTKDVLYLYRREMERLAWPQTRFVSEVADAVPFPAAPAHDPAAPTQPSFTALDLDDPEPHGGAAIEKIGIAADGEPLPSLAGGERIELDVTVRAAVALEEPFVLFALRNPMGQIVFCGDSRDATRPLQRLAQGKQATVRFAFDLPFLPTGTYALEVFLHSGSGAKPLCRACCSPAAMLQVLSAHISHGLANLHTESELEVVHEPA